MRYDSHQFGSFDSPDNRQTVYALFERMGNGLPEEVAAMQRAGFLQGLIDLSTTGLAGLPLRVPACSAGEAYRWFNAITGAFGVPVEEAAVLLERVIRRMETRREGVVIG